MQVPWDNPRVNPLWDGKGCSQAVNCCAQAGMPWFCIKDPPTGSESILDTQEPFKPQEFASVIMLHITATSSPQLLVIRMCGYRPLQCTHKSPYIRTHIHHFATCTVYALHCHLRTLCKQCNTNTNLLHFCQECMCCLLFVHRQPYFCGVD